MRYYHFTAKHLIHQIAREGLTLGKFPLVSEAGISFTTPCQWLTTSDGFDTQSWNTSQLIKYDRNDYRLTVEIPYKAQKNVVKATDYIKRIPVEYRHIATNWPGSDDWYLYIGKINPEWIKEYKENPILIKSV